MTYRKSHFSIHVLLIIVSMMATMNIAAQIKPVWSSLPALPDDKGWAGMYAGVSKGLLFCMGGANFPGKPPWEGGKKKWYDHIYMLSAGGSWTKLSVKLPEPMGYGAFVSYRDAIILIGGGNEHHYLNQVLVYTWTGKTLELRKYPDLPTPLANMTGALVGHLIVVAGGNTKSEGPAAKICYGLDLENVSEGWFALDPWPGAERSFPVSAGYKGQFYLFSGETVGTNASGEKFSQVLQDGYRLSLYRKGDQWAGRWQTLAPMPKGISAGASPLPVLENKYMVFWGGVDALTRLQKDPVHFPGISRDVLLYDPGKDSWIYAGPEKGTVARVNLPVIYWNDQWIYIGGETGPGVRTNAVTILKNNLN
jgi:N-acetylneuraminic acid mutarotase